MTNIKKSKKVLYADFHNADQDGLLRLNTNGTLSDIKKHKIIFKRGETFVFSDGELSAIGVIEEPGVEGVWRAKVDWKKLAMQAEEAIE